MGKIIHILYSGMGGIGTYFRSLIEGPKDPEISESALFYGVTQLHEEYGNLCDECGIPYAYLSKMRGPDIFSWIRMIRFLKKENPDVIVLHSAAAVLPVVYYAKRARKGFIFVEHTPDETKTSAENRMSKSANQNGNFIIAFSEQHKKDLADHYGDAYQLSKVRIIKKGIDLNFFKPSDSRRDVSDPLVIGMQGRLTSGKDHETLIRSFALVSQKLGPTKLLLRFAGDGPERENLNAVVEELNISASVEFCGSLSRPELLGFLQSLDIYVHATHGETICYSIMEAQGVGLPVVASRVKGVDEVLSHEEDSLLFEDANAEDLAAQLTKLIESPELRTDLGDKSRKLVESEFSQASMARDFRGLYRSILSES